jgi:hypothetical protein
MNDDFRDLKLRLRKLDALLEGGKTGNLPFAQAVSAARRAVKTGDRSRKPTVALLGLLDKAETLGRGLEQR